MNKKQVMTTITEALREVQALGGHEWSPPSGAVIGGLEGFDSLTGIETTVLVEQKLRAKLGDTTLSLGRDSIFVSGTRALVLTEVVSVVVSSIAAAQKAA